jgi:hypothetical protein
LEQPGGYEGSIESFGLWNWPSVLDSKTLIYITIGRLKTRVFFLYQKAIFAAILKYAKTNLSHEFYR